MPDRIPELDLLAAEAREVTMMPVDEVRRRGNRRRTARMAGITAGALALVAVAGVGIWNSPLADGPRGTQWANPAIPSPEPTATSSESPTDSPTVPNSTHQPNLPAPVVDPPTWDNLPTGAMLTEPHQSSILEVIDQREGPGDEPLGLCQPTDWGSPRTFLTRSYGARVDDPVPYRWAVVLGFDSVEQADAAFELLAKDATDCGDKLEAAGWHDPVLTDTAATVDFVLPVVSYSTMARSADPDNDPGVFSDTLIVRADERVLWVNTSFEGWDDNCAMWGDPDLPPCAITAHFEEMVETLTK